MHSHIQLAATRVIPATGSSPIRGEGDRRGDHQTHRERVKNSVIDASHHVSQCLHES